MPKLIQTTPIFTDQSETFRPVSSESEQIKKLAIWFKLMYGEAESCSQESLERLSERATVTPKIDALHDEVQSAVMEIRAIAGSGEYDSKLSETIRLAHEVFMAHYPQIKRMNSPNHLVPRNLPPVSAPSFALKELN